MSVVVNRIPGLAIFPLEPSKVVPWSFPVKSRFIGGFREEAVVYQYTERLCQCVVIVMFRYNQAMAIAPENVEIVDKSASSRSVLPNTA